ncbi:MAG: VOC family protein [Blastocatellia bacterium]
MPNDIVHFAINADDCDRAKQFYTDAFGWTFEPWGPPDFWRVFTSPDAIHGALQKRREPVSGTGMTGYECSISVEDIKASVAAIEAAGGEIVFPPFLIEHVGTVAQFKDTEGNIACVMQYLEGVK